MSAPSRSTVSEQSDGLRIRIRASEDVYTALLLPLSVGVAALLGILISFAGDSGWLDRITLLFCACACLAVLCWCAWYVLGSDVVIVSADRLSIRREILGVHRQTTYDVHQVSKLRFVPPIPQEEAAATPAVIVFDYRGKTPSFAEGISEEEASQIIAVIKSRAELNG